MSNEVSGILNFVPDPILQNNKNYAIVGGKNTSCNKDSPPHKFRDVNSGIVVKCDAGSKYDCVFCYKSYTKTCDFNSLKPRQEWNSDNGVIRCIYDLDELASNVENFEKYDEIFSNSLPEEREKLLKKVCEKFPGYEKCKTLPPPSDGGDGGGSGGGGSNPILLSVGLLVGVLVILGVGFLLLRVRKSKK